MKKVEKERQRGNVCHNGIVKTNTRLRTGNLLLCRLEEEYEALNSVDEEVDLVVIPRGKRETETKEKQIERETLSDSITHRKRVRRRKEKERRYTERVCVCECERE